MLEQNIAEFISYCWSYYGTDGMYAIEDLTLHDLTNYVYKYLVDCDKLDVDVMFDSVDREMVSTYANFPEKEMTRAERLAHICTAPAAK